MRNGISAILACLLLLALGACRQYVTLPVRREPVITSIDAFPTVLGPGDSTRITVHAMSPSGESLVYDWEPYNGLFIQGHTHGYDDDVYNTHSPSMVFYRSSDYVSDYDTAFVWCGVRDGKGGGAYKQVLILYAN